MATFPSPCGVRRVKDNDSNPVLLFLENPVSVPLRGKEGEGHFTPSPLAGGGFRVSVPLRGKEGEGPDMYTTAEIAFCLFPSPCGVRRVKDLIISIAGWMLRFGFRPLAG